jgi:hypothetical protein
LCSPIVTANNVLPADPGLPEYGDGNGGDYPIDGSPVCDVFCDLSEPQECGTPLSSLDELSSQNSNGLVPGHCVNLFLIHVLYDENKAAFERYRNLMHDGYDGNFKRYSDYILASIQPQIL